MTTAPNMTDDLPNLARLPVAVKRHPLVHEVGRRLDEHGKHTPGDFVVVGVSGGADSVALLLAMAALGQRQSRSGGAYVRPVAVHVHHHLRESADRDAAFVESLCGSLNIPFRMIDIDAGGRGGNVSATARALRYHALSEQAAQNGARLVAVAHHAEDQLETMLMALCRGTGLDGLGGMPWVRSLKDDIELIRPLLAVRRADCEALCAEAGVSWVDDPTNRDLSKSRARLRHEVLPILDELWPNAAARTTATSELVRVAASVLEQSLDESFGAVEQLQWQRAVLAERPVAVVTAGLRRAALRLSPGVADQLGHRQLDDAGRCIVSGDGTPKQFDWPGGLQLKIDATTVALQRTDIEAQGHFRDENV